MKKLEILIDAGMFFWLSDGLSKLKYGVDGLISLNVKVTEKNAQRRARSGVLDNF